MPHTNNSRGDGKLATVPKVRLYVDRHAGQDNWFVHIGHVTERGRWRTAPHSHPKYGQVIFVRNGRGVMNLDGLSVPFEGPCALLLPAECVHGLDYEEDVDRWVVTIDVVYLAQINARLQEFTQLWSRPRVISLAYGREVEQEFYRLIRRLEREALSNAIGHAAGMESLLTTLLLMLLRGMPDGQFDSDSASHSDVRLADRFRELIDQYYGKNLQLQDYASMMAVSLAQLRAACTAARGQSPAKMIHSRIVTEAKRNLIFGNLPVEQIAFGLGFDDAAYFTRFFRREVGQTPSMFRSAAQKQTGPGK